MSYSDDRRKYENDVFYEAYRRGLDPDRAVHCASDCFDRGREPEQCVDAYARQVRQQREERQAAEQQEAEAMYEQERAYYDQQEEPDAPAKADKGKERDSGQ